MYDRVVTINNTHWPAYRKPGSILVDLRMFDPNDRSANPRLVFRCEKLRELGIPDALIKAAAKSDPQGFLLFDDLPNQTEPATGQADQTTTQPELGGAPCPKTCPKLKLVMLFNARNQTYCVCSHNLTAEEASQELDRLRRDRLPAFTVEQRQHHRAKDADGCWECRGDISHAIAPVRSRSEAETRSGERQL